jgi:hypothetical protein
MIPSWRRSYIRYRTYFLNVIGRYRQRADIKAYLEILLSLATISIFALLALKPTLLTIAELMKEIESKKATLTTMNQKIQNISKAQTLYDQERPKIELLRVAIPKDPELDVFVRQVEGLLGKHQVALSTFSLGKTMILGEEVPKSTEPEETAPLPNNANELSFSLNTTVDITQYSYLLAFLADLEKLRKPVKIDSVNLASAETKEEKTMVLVVSGRVPFLKDKNESLIK